MQVRLLMCFVATHPDKMDDTKAGSQLHDLSWPSGRELQFCELY